MRLRAAVANVYPRPRFCINDPSCPHGGACHFLHKRTGPTKDDDGPAAPAAEASKTADAAGDSQNDGGRTEVLTAAGVISTVSLVACPFCTKYLLDDGRGCVNRVSGFLRHCLRDCDSGPRLCRLCPVNMSLLDLLHPGDPPCPSNGVTSALSRLEADPDRCPLCLMAIVVETALPFHVLAESLWTTASAGNVYGCFRSCRVRGGAVPRK